MWLGDVKIIIPKAATVILTLSILLSRRNSIYKTLKSLYNSNETPGIKDGGRSKGLFKDDGGRSKGCFKAAEGRSKGFKDDRIRSEKGFKTPHLRPDRPLFMPNAVIWSVQGFKDDGVRSKLVFKPPPPRSIISYRGYGILK
jgi:hypothetical protein